MNTFLIWSNEHRMWWRAAYRGYTDSIEEAGRYPHAVAVRIVLEASANGQLMYDRTDPMTGRQYRQAPEVLVLAPEHITVVGEVVKDRPPRCQEPTCPDFGDPDFGEGTCPSEHAHPSGGESDA